MLYPRLVCAVLALVGLLAAPAHADDMVPVPDVRGMTEAQARQVLNRAGLRLGGSEAVSEAVLKSQFGRTYDPGTVVQQSPPPSVSDQPSWVRRGGDVWLRVAAGRARAPTPVVPAQPGTATVPGTTIPSPPAGVPGTTIPAPPSSMPRTPSMPTTVTRVPTTTTPAPVRTTWAGNTPPRPPPPYALEGSPMPAQPRTVIPAPVTTTPSAPIGTVPATPAQPAAPAPAAATAPRCFTLSCERKENGWHVRANAGAAFWAGPDSGDIGLYGGVDLGYTMCDCIGFDAFYRYAGTQFDRTLPNGLLEDSGDFHTVGLKATFDKSFGENSRWYWFAGLGAGYYKSRRFQVDDDGVSAFGEAGLGWMLSNSLRLRLALNVHTLFNAKVGRNNPANDNSGRTLWLFAPTLGFDLDF